MALGDGTDVGNDMKTLESVCILQSGTFNGRKRETRDRGGDWELKSVEVHRFYGLSYLFLYHDETRSQRGQASHPTEGGQGGGEGQKMWPQ